MSENRKVTNSPLAVTADKSHDMKENIVSIKKKDIATGPMIEEIVTSPSHMYFQLSIMKLMMFIGGVLVSLVQPQGEG